MTNVQNTAETGQADGTLVTQANSVGGGDALTIIDTGNTEIVYHSGAALRGSRGFRHAASSGVASYIGWQNVAGASTATALRMKFRFSALPTAENNIANIRSAGGGTGLVNLIVGIDGKLRVGSDPAAAILGTTTGTLSPNTVYRAELGITNPSTTTGTATLRVYLGDSTTPIANMSLDLTGVNFGAAVTMGTCRFGRNKAAGGTWSFDFDDIAFQTGSAALIGPASPDTPTDAYGQVVAGDTPSAWWRLDNSLTDFYGGATGTATGGPSYSSSLVTGHAAGASMLFDGVDDAVSIPSSATFQTTGNFTIEAWVNPNGFAKLTHRFVDFCGVSYGLQANVWGIPVFYISNGAGGWTSIEGVAALEFGKNAHIVGVKSGTTATLYVNGQQVATQTITGTHGSTGGAVLGGDVGGDAWFNGRIDEVAFYKRVLTPTEITEHYTAGAPAVTNVSPSGAVGSAPTPLAPAVTRGAITVSPAAAGSPPSLASPTVVRGAITVSPSTVGTAPTSAAPTVGAGAISVSPSGSVGSAPSMVDPAVTLGPPMVSPSGPVGSAPTPRAPTVIPGAVTVGPAAATTSPSLASPTVVGKLTVSPELATYPGIALAPVVTSGPITVTPDPVGDPAVASSPRVIGDDRVFAYDGGQWDPRVPKKWTGTAWVAARVHVLR